MYVKLSDVFDLNLLDQNNLCKSFGMKKPPRISFKKNTTQGQ